MRDIEAAWLAGFFDGEGSLAHYRGGGTGQSSCWLICISNTHLGSLEHSREIAGCGRVGYKQVPAGNKAQYQWRVHARNDIISVCEQMLPYLVVKRDVVQRFLEAQRDVAQG